jgi:hypothetical protein
LAGTLERLGGREKNGCGLEMDLFQGVAALHLTLPALHGTVVPVRSPGGPTMRDIFTFSRKTSFRLRLGAAFGALLGLLVFGQAAEAANPLELNFWLSGPKYEGRLAPCESALGTITSQFQEKESTFWNSALQITAFGRIHETAFRPWQSDNIPRRYCSGDVMLSDGKLRTVHYSIIEDGGFAGYNQGVEWCVTGLDRNWAYNPACRAARP